MVVHDSTGDRNPTEGLRIISKFSIKLTHKDMFQKLCLIYNMIIFIDWPTNGDNLKLINVRNLAYNGYWNNGAPKEVQYIY